MSDTHVSQSFTGWHRHKLGWLAADRKTWVNAPATAGFTTRTTLSPLDGEYGISMLVMDLRSTAKVLVAPGGSTGQGKRRHVLG